MTLSDRIAQLSGPDRALTVEIARVIVEDASEWTFNAPINFTDCLVSLDAAMSIVAPAMQEHVMREALTLVAPRGSIVGKFTETLARAICEVSMRERGL